ncbi:hypothetical protein Sjap_008354 [Stephania japonica]|uniref:Uncharacterized protein n=1 Tax=Stephania japonica TaxID=461633 RepID=A0AAP0JRL9_9MAGN
MKSKTLITGGVKKGFYNKSKLLWDLRNTMSPVKVFLGHSKGLRYTAYVQNMFLFISLLAQFKVVEEDSESHVIKPEAMVMKIPNSANTHQLSDLFDFSSSFLHECRVLNLYGLNTHDHVVCENEFMLELCAHAWFPRGIDLNINCDVEQVGNDMAEKYSKERFRTQCRPAPYAQRFDEEMGFAQDLLDMFWEVVNHPRVVDGELRMGLTKA